MGYKQLETPAEQMKILKNYVGTEVTVVQAQGGVLNAHKVQLNAVDEFTGIGTTGGYMHFVGFDGSAIAQITTDNKIIYKNPYVDENYGLKTCDAVYDLMLKLFGTAVLYDIVRQRGIKTSQDVYACDDDPFDKCVKAWEGGGDLAEIGNLLRGKV